MNLRVRFATTQVRYCVAAPPAGAGPEGHRCQEMRQLPLPLPGEAAVRRLSGRGTGRTLLPGLQFMPPTPPPFMLRWRIGRDTAGWARIPAAASLKNSGNLSPRKGIGRALPTLPVRRAVTSEWKSGVLPLLSRRRPCAAFAAAPITACIQYYLSVVLSMGLVLSTEYPCSAFLCRFACRKRNRSAMRKHRGPAVIVRIYTIRCKTRAAPRTERGRR